MITRDNYEEYFLLYIDNELAIADRKAVERFVSDHPDLQEEWETLLQCRIVPEQPLAFPGREALLQPRPDLLSYIDGELDDKERMAAEEFVHRHPHAAAELKELRRTINYPDPALVFPDKAGLYKNEGDRKIILLPWIRIGAVAAIAGIAVLLWLMPRHTHREGMAAATAPSGGMRATAGPQATAASGLPATTAPEHPATPSAAHPAVALSEHQATPSAEGTATASSGRQAALPRTKGRNKKNDPAVTPATTTALYITGKRNEEEGGDPMALRTPEKIQPAGRQEIGAKEIGAKEIGAKEIGANVPVVAQQISIPREESSFATQALQNESNDPENNSLVADEPAAAGKARLRGIFRKVTRVFGKTADRDKDGQREVLIGAFQFALK